MLYLHMIYLIKFLIILKQFTTYQPFLVYGVALVLAILYHHRLQDSQHIL